MPAPLSSEDRAWVIALKDSIWIPARPPNPFTGRDATRRPHPNRSVQLDEWTRLAELIRTHSLPCELGAGLFGFGLSIRIFDHASMPEVPPESLIVITDDQMFPHEDGATAADLAWNRFSPLTHRPENERVCQFYNIEPPHPRQHYDY